jgi:hypothetical protein
MRRRTAGNVASNLSPSHAFGLRHDASRATSFSGLAFVPQRSSVAPFQSRAEAVGQAASPAAPGSLSDPCAGPPFVPSCVHGVGQDASATVLRLLSVLPAALYPCCAGVPAIGVGQPAAICATSPRESGTEF